MEKRFDVIYYSQKQGEGRKFSHQYPELWSTTEAYCPRCAKKEVWFRDDGGDYYVGEQYICIACKGTFYLPAGVSECRNEQDEQRLAHLTANAKT